MLPHVYRIFHMVILVLYLQLFHVLIFLKSRCIALTFCLCKAWFDVWIIFLKFLLFLTSTYSLHSNKCFSTFCNDWPGLSVLLLIENAVTYHQKPACKCDFICFVLSVGDFGTLMKALWKYLIMTHIVIFSVIRIIRTFWGTCLNFLLFWHKLILRNITALCNRNDEKLESLKMIMTKLSQSKLSWEQNQNHNKCKKWKTCNES